ncbi:hypothetical protein K435DRAFT_791172 [Dendrothele bispora CBS 962.96]|uniref:Uncharacterized protein n=1 Tax=Dendrothele bispora (strain CBS 962.96) TaxID=1314807 RepID=A0A4S8MML5_DENBC|nr:hypothetical protein K435DRAFT_791172 [Dendrothele bispora CBS 962.96]
MDSHSSFEPHRQYFRGPNVATKYKLGTGGHRHGIILSVLLSQNESFGPCNMLAIKNLPYETNIVKQNWSTLRKTTTGTDFERLVKVLEMHCNNSLQQLGKPFSQGDPRQNQLLWSKDPESDVAYHIGSLYLRPLLLQNQKINPVSSSPTDTFAGPNEMIPKVSDFTLEEKEMRAETALGGRVILENWMNAILNLLQAAGIATKQAPVKIVLANFALAAFQLRWIIKGAYVEVPSDDLQALLREYGSSGLSYQGRDLLFLYPLNKLRIPLHMALFGTFALQNTTGYRSPGNSPRSRDEDEMLRRSMHRKKKASGEGNAKKVVGFLADIEQMEAIPIVGDLKLPHFNQDIGLPRYQAPNPLEIINLQGYKEDYVPALHCTAWVRQVATGGG